jgi:hypothetical protein
MKKYAGIAAIICSMVPTALVSRSHETLSHSFMFTRPASYTLSMRQALWHDFIYYKEGKTHGAFQAIGFYQNSENLARTQRYFLPRHKNTVLVAGDAIQETFFTRDVRAEWLNLPSDFSGVLTIGPVQKQIGFLLEYNQDLCRFTESSLFENLWLDISIPFIQVQNRFNPEQYDLILGTSGNSPDAPRDLIQAFNQPAWKFHHFSPHTLTRFNAAELRIDLGSSYKMNNHHHQFGYYSTLIIPIDGKQSPCFIFSPYVGNNYHIGVGGGLLMNILLNRDDSHVAVCYFIELEGMWFAKNFQKRTFDLMNKPWSRFLQFNIENGTPEQNIPGVNILTFDVTVRPYGIFDFSTGWQVQAGPFTVEISYNIWGHAQEKIAFHKRFEETFCLNNYGIAGTGSMLVDGISVATSASNSTINHQAANDLVFVPLKPLDIDLKSGRATSALNHKVQFVLGMERQGKQVGTFFGIGTFVDIPQKNPALQLWGAWIKCGASF